VPVVGACVAPINQGNFCSILALPRTRGDAKSADVGSAQPEERFNES